jgi:2-methylcitrate dehydratase PrpD
LYESVLQRDTNVANGAQTEAEGAAMIELTREVGGAIAAMHYDAIPEEAVRTAGNGITDCAAVTILGRDTDVVRILRSVLKLGAGSGEARICFGADGAPATQAALVNATAAHALDYDDIGLNSVQPTHPSAVLAPAILAEAEALGCSGRDMLTAYVVGFEVWGEIGSRDRKPYHVKGWHPTATFGAIAAAAAAAKLHRLDAVRSAHAIGIAASQAGGVVANFGSMMKPFHAGRAAHVGILSARLAAAGMTAAADTLENRQGFLNAMSSGGEVDLARPVRIGRQWWSVVDGLGFKLYPMCYGTHRALDGMIALVKEHDVLPDSVADIDVEAAQVQLANLVHHDPWSELHAKFSMEFAMAMAVIARRATLAEVNDSFVQRPDVRALMKKVRITIIPPADPSRHRTPPADGVIVTLNDGQKLERRFQQPLGHPTRPVSAEVLWLKFLDCTRGALSEIAARRLFDQLQNLAQIASVAEFAPIAVLERQPALSG